MLRARGRGGGIEVWDFGALEVSCGRVDVEVLRYEDLELRRHAAGLETWRYRDLELRRRAAGPGTLRCRHTSSPAPQLLPVIQLFARLPT